MKHHFEIMDNDNVSTDTTSLQASYDIFIMRNWFSKTSLHVSVQYPYCHESAFARLEKRIKVLSHEKNNDGKLEAALVEAASLAKSLN